MIRNLGGAAFNAAIIPIVVAGVDSQSFGQNDYCATGVPAALSEVPQMPPVLPEKS